MKPMDATVERLYELLADRAGGEDLGTAEQRELDHLQARHPDVEPESFELAAAALHLAFVAPNAEELPARLRARLIDQADALLEDPHRRGAVNPFATPWPGWLVAAAAVIFLLLQPKLDSTSRAPDIDELRRAPDLVEASWTATDDPGGAGVRGEVFWSDELQTGYMRFRGLAENDPAQGQYQLWIFDAERPAEYPVDGGVFDATGSEVIVPIDAKIAVAEPTLFAVTYERPGGVVVSTRERLLLTGTPQ